MQILTSGLARQRVAATLFWRGFLITLCAAVAVRWPADGLLVAMGLVGAIAIGFGIYDVFTASRLYPAKRWVLLLHGALSLLFGAASIAALGLSRHQMITLFAAWLAIASAAAISAAIVAGARRSATVLCLTIFAANVVAIVLLAGQARLSVLLLLYAGACYATLVGMTEVGLGRWLRQVAGKPDFYQPGGLPAHPARRPLVRPFGIRQRAESAWTH